MWGTKEGQRDRSSSIFPLQEQTVEETDSSAHLGNLAPPWLPDSAVSMCQLCSAHFTVTRRRHHCRACGKVGVSLSLSLLLPPSLPPSLPLSLSLSLSLSTPCSHSSLFLDHSHLTVYHTVVICDVDLLLRVLLLSGSTEVQKQQAG